MPSTVHMRVRPRMRVAEMGQNSSLAVARDAMAYLLNAA